MNVLAVSSVALGSALTFVLGAQEKSCFYIFTEKPKTKVGYYFAVQSGGDFDVDYTVKGPDQRVIMSDQKQRQGDWILNAETPGEYEFCFSNEMSTFAEKVVDFEINLENDFRAEIPQQPQGSQVSFEGVWNSIEVIEDKLNGLVKSLNYYKTRNNRNQSTVKSTENRIFYFSVYEVILIVGMACLQVGAIQLFFKSSRKQLV